MGAELSSSRRIQPAGRQQGWQASLGPPAFPFILCIISPLPLSQPRAQNVPTPLTSLGSPCPFTHSTQYKTKRRFSRGHRSQKCNLLFSLINCLYRPRVLLVPGAVPLGVTGTVGISPGLFFTQMCNGPCVDAGGFPLLLVDL